MSAEDRMEWALRWIMIGAVVFVALMFAVVAAFAHDHNRPDLDNWYKDLHSKGGAWCCDGPKKDALHLRDADWENVDGHYRVRVPKDIDAFQDALKGKAVDTMWMDVPDEAVIEKPNLDGTTLVWPTYGYEPKVRCFMPGAMI